MIYLHVNFTILDYIEWSSVALSLTFLILLIQENKWCWPFGIVSSALSIYLFYEFKLYSEAVLYLFYVLFGIYGWYVWSGKHTKTSQQDTDAILDFKEAKKANFIPVSSWAWAKHIPILTGGIVCSYLLALFFKTQTDAERTYVDATTTIFSLIATYMEAHKVFSSWIFWILINGTSIWLYYDRGLPVYAGLMLIYFGVSIYGFFDWGKKAKLF